MSLDADLIVDRRRMRRKLTFWRVLAVLILIGAIVAVTATVTRRDGGGLTAGSDHIARVRITGLIRNDQERVEALEKLAKAKSAKAVIVHIDSPGSTTAGSEQRPERFAVGQKVDARVTQFDKKARKVGVSIKALEVAEEKEAIAQYGSSDSGATLGDILGHALKRKDAETEDAKD